MVKIRQHLVSASIKRSVTSPGTNTKKFIVIHETDNTRAGASADAHARLQANGNSRQASWQYTVDSKEIVQSFSDDTKCWAAGSRYYNENGINIEICVNSDDNFKKAVDNTVELVKMLMKKYNIPLKNVIRHKDSSGKNCPRNLISGAKGITWSDFKKKVAGSSGSVTASKPTPSKPSTSKPTPKPSQPTPSGSLKVGSKVTLNKSASKYATGQTIPASVKGKTYTVQQVKGNQVLLKEIYSWVYAKDVGGSSASSSTSSTSASSSKTTSGALKVGSKVKIKSSASKYATGENIPASVKNKTYTVQQVGSGRVLLKEIYSWVKTSDIEGQSSGSQTKKPAPKPQAKSFKVGQVVTLKKSASKFATGQSILNSVKGKKYTILQVKPDRVLLGGIMSWVKKTDIQ